MNCNELEFAAADLERGQMMDAAKRDEAIAHAASCEGCALRLGDERALTRGLRLVAEAAREQAPARIEAGLIAAFREQHSSVAPIAPSRTERPRWLYLVAGIAASALIIAVLALAASRMHDSRRPAPQQASGQDRPPQWTEEKQAAPQADPSAHPGEPREPDPVTATRNNRGEVKPARARRSKPPAQVLNKPGDSEIATDFIPLVNRETFSEMDGGQVMRVELPRSVLMSYGLPMSMDRATERIKADLVVGNDGLARAIRFVR